MNTEEHKDPAKCDRCDCSVERGWSERWKSASKNAKSIRTECVCLDCDELERVAEYLKDKVISGSFMLRAVCAATHEEFRKDPASRSYGTSPRKFIETYMEVNESIKRIQSQIKIFEQVVWFGGLKSQVNAADFRGFRMNFGNNIAMVYSMAGRTQITIQNHDGNKQISVLTAEDSTSPVMGLNSMSGTEEECIQLLVNCQNAYKRGHKFVQNNEVGLGL